MKKFNDPVEGFLSGLSEGIVEWGEQNKADFANTRRSRSLPYTLAFVLLAIVAFAAFAVFVRA